MARADRTRYTEAEALTGLALVSAGTRPRSAVAPAQAGLAIADECGFRLLAAQAHTALAIASTMDGEYGIASDGATTALHLFRASGHRIGEATAMAILGRLRQPAAVPDAPDGYTRAAEALADECGAARPPLPWPALAS
jgi:hypothetical protein